MQIGRLYANPLALPARMSLKLVFQAVSQLSIANLSAGLRIKRNCFKFPGQFMDDHLNFFSLLCRRMLNTRCILP